MTLDEIKSALVGSWISVASEVRPSKGADGTIKPLFLSRTFVYLAGDRFELTVMNHADPYGKTPLARIDLAGHMSWAGEHPIAPGAQKVDFVADEAYAVTPLLQAFADVLNQVATDGYARWQPGQKQEILGKSFPPFRLIKGQDFKEYDLIYLTSS